MDPMPSGGRPCDGGFRRAERRSPLEASVPRPGVRGSPREGRALLGPTPSRLVRKGQVCCPFQRKCKTTPCKGSQRGDRLVNRRADWGGGRRAPTPGVGVDGQASRCPTAEPASGRAARLIQYGTNRELKQQEMQRQP